MNFFKKLFSFGKKPAKDLDKNETDDLKNEKVEEIIQKDFIFLMRINGLNLRFPHLF